MCKGVCSINKEDGLWAEGDGEKNRLSVKNKTMGWGNKGDK